MRSLYTPILFYQLYASIPILLWFLIYWKIVMGLKSITVIKQRQ